MKHAVTLLTAIFVGKKMSGKKWEGRSLIFCRPCFCHFLVVLLPALLLVPSASAQESGQAKPARPAAKKAAKVLPAPPMPTLANVPYGAHERHAASACPCGRG